MAEAEKSQRPSRWWEFYVVRHFIGTIFGSGAILVFNEYSASPLHGKLFPNISSFQSSGIYHLVVLIALGLAYSFVTSAPMLTIHALRAEIDFDDKRGVSCSLLWIIPIFLVTSLFAWVLLNPPLIGWKIASLAGVSFILTLQIALFAKAAKNRFKRIGLYYQSLTTARASKAPQVIEYVESYRHLREHANAFAIITFQFAFSLEVIALDSLSSVCALLILWIFPAVLVWLIATFLEAKFANPSK
ncbi:MAG: hypothetical protein ACXWJK_12095 [Burkholderiaceae bacterium]